MAVLLPHFELSVKFTTDFSRDAENEGRRCTFASGNRGVAAKLHGARTFECLTAAVLLHDQDICARGLHVQLDRAKQAEDADGYDHVGRPVNVKGGQVGNLPHLAGRANINSAP